MITLNQQHSTTSDGYLIMKRTVIAPWT